MSKYPNTPHPHFGTSRFRPLPQGERKYLEYQICFQHNSNYQSQTNVLDIRIWVLVIIWKLVLGFLNFF
jgi:hypothetical protein